MIIDTDGSVCDLMKNLRIILGISLSLAARKTNSHLKLIFNVPQTIKITESLIKDGKLLQAHKK